MMSGGMGGGVAGVVLTILLVLLLVWALCLAALGALGIWAFGRLRHDSTRAYSVDRDN